MLDELREKIDAAAEMLKDFKRFLDLFKKDATGDLTRLSQTISRISFLLKANDVKDVLHPREQILQKRKASLVKVRPCGDEYKNKTYLGFYLGDVALGSSMEVTDDKIQLGFSGHNPMIFIPEIGDVVYGCGSWWSYIDKEEDFKEITDSDIANTWYVKMAKEYFANHKPEKENADDIF